MVLFETERLRVQRFGRSDADLFFLVNGDAELMRFIRPAKTREASDAFLEENLLLYGENSVQGRYAVFAKDTGDFVGTFSFLYLQGSQEMHIGYALLPAARKKGYAVELVKNGCDYFFRHTAYDCLYAITSAPNTASQRVLERAGFVLKSILQQQGEDLQLFYLER